MIKSRKRCNVFLCVARQRDIGEVASLRAEGVDRQPQKRLFYELGKAAKLILTEPLRLRHLPYPRSARQRRTLLRCPILQFNFYICTHYRMPIETRLIQTEGDFAPFQPRSHRVHSVFANFTVLSTLNSLP